MKLICVTVEIREGSLAPRAGIAAPSVERALKLAGRGKLRGSSPKWGKRLVKARI